MASTITASTISAFSILTSIRENGLLPRSLNPACIASENDGQSANQVCCNYYHPDIPDSRDLTFSWTTRQTAGQARVMHQLHSLVYDEATGIYPVSMEKYPGGTFNTDKEFLLELAKRVQNNVCLILHKDALDEGKDVVRKYTFGKAKAYLDVATHQEIRYLRQIAAKHIRFVLAPLHLVPLAQKAFGEMVIPIPDCKTDVDLGIIKDRAPMIRFEGMECRVSLIAPDYHQALQKLGALLKEGFLTHVVRLPCPSDLSKKEGEKKFAVKVAPHEHQKICQIMNSDLFRVAKCYDRTNLNEYYVTCQEKDADALQTIIKK